MTEWRDLPPPPDPTQPGWDVEGYPDAPDAPPGADPVGVVAIVLGCIGIVAFGIVLAPITGLLAAIAGGRARDSRRSFETAYIGLGLAVLDGVVWLVLHFLFDLTVMAG